MSKKNFYQILIIQNSMKNITMNYVLHVHHIINRLLIRIFIIAYVK
jgi:hypothetical protein